MLKKILVVCAAALAFTAIGQEALAQETIDKFGFGMGLGLQWNVSGPDLVSEASIDANGVVRVDDRSNTEASFIGEVHAFPWTNGQVGVGPFAAMQMGSDEIVQAVGLGIMVGIKKTGQQALGIGIGYAAQMSRKVLGDEFVENTKAPLGPDGKPLPMRLKETDNGALMVVLSVVF